MADDNEDICGYCGKSGTDKVASWVGGGIYWPGEFQPPTRYVHAACEDAECARAHAALTPEQQQAFLRRIR